MVLGTGTFGDLVVLLLLLGVEGGSIVLLEMRVSGREAEQPIETERLGLVLLVFCGEEREETTDRQV